MRLICIAILIAATGLDDDQKSAKELLRTHGLIRSGSTYVLPGERELSSGLREIKDLEKDLADAVKKRDQWQRWIAERRWQLQSGAGELERLAVLLGRADDVDDHNEVVMRMNAVSAQVRALERQIQDAEKNEQIPGNVAKARAAFQDRVKESNELVHNVQSNYQKLAADPEIVEALVLASGKPDKPYEIGPLKRFERDVEQLRQYEEIVVVDHIDLRPNGGTYLVDTVINGKHPKVMILDTGASIVLLNESTARAAGVKLDTAERAYAKVADGRIIESRRVVLDSITVGRFAIRNVECAVLPDGMVEIEALLGGSFLDNFTYTVDPNANVLTLTRENVDAAREK